MQTFSSLWLVSSSSGATATNWLLYQIFLEFPEELFVEKILCMVYAELHEIFSVFQEKLKERERELRKRKEREEQEMERVRLKVRRKEAVTSFQALLVETIKDPQVL